MKPLEGVVIAQIEQFRFFCRIPAKNLYLQEFCNMKHFVLMADIKDSRLKNSKNLSKNFGMLTAALNKKYKKILLSPLTITLGDEFQGIIDSLHHCVELIMMSEELILKGEYGFKLKYVVNYGNIDTAINKKIAYGMLGNGLTEAREKLNNIKKSEARFLINVHNRTRNEQLNNIFFIYQSFIDEWREKDMEIVKAFMNFKDYKKVSVAIGINPSSAWRREKSLRIKQYFAIKNVILSLSKDI